MELGCLPKAAWHRLMQAYYNSRKFWTKATLRSKVEIADKLELIGAEFKKINPNFRGSADNE